MPEFNVIWEIEIEADSPKEAAEKALEIMRDKESTATFFNVTNYNTNEETDIDLTYDDYERDD